MQLMLSKCNIIVLCIGILVTLLGISLLSCFWAIQEYIISSALKIAPNSKAFNSWRKPSTPITLSIYLFNWTNPEDIYNTSIKPNFEEVGPYRFLLVKEKTNITWNPQNETISYQYLKYFYFDEENSPCKETDVVTTINMVALTAAHAADDWNLVPKHLVINTLYNSKMYVTKTVRELLFEGYTDPILAEVKAIPFVTDDNIRFGWFHDKNGTVGGDGVYNMATSADENFGAMKMWNYDNKTPFYEGHCANVGGSSEMYPRNVKPTEIHFFSPEMCRTAKFNFDRNVTVKGTLGYKFLPDIEVFDNGTVIPENKCYCNGKCMPMGVMNISSCREDAPVFLSLPHFYHADTTYVNAVEGMHPERDKHELYITLEPNTGVISDISARMQINVLLHPILDFRLFENAPTVMFPVLWFEQQVIMSDELVSGLTLLFNLPNINKYVSSVVVVVGLLCILSVIMYAVCYKQKKISEIKLAKEEIPLKSIY